MNRFYKSSWLFIYFFINLTTIVVNLLLDLFYLFIFCNLLQLGLKLNSIPQSDYYFDMEYCVEYSTFRTLPSGKFFYMLVMVFNCYLTLFVLPEQERDGCGGFEDFFFCMGWV